MASTSSLPSFNSSFAPSHFTLSKFSHNIYGPSSSSTVTFPRPLLFSSTWEVSTAERTRSSSSSSSIASPGSLYEVLGIQMGATCQEIKAAYRRLARVSHPDVAKSRREEPGGDHDEFIKVHEAYVTLSDPQKRSHYDRLLVVGGGSPRSSHVASSPKTATASASAAASRFYGYSRRRRWETNQCW